MEILRGILERLFHITLISSMMFGVIVLIRMLFLRRIKAKFIYFLWIIFLIRLIFPWEIPFQMSVENFVPVFFEEYKESREIINTHNINEDLITYGSVEKEIYEYSTWSNKVMNVFVYIWLFGIFAIMLFPIISYKTLMKAIDEDERSEDQRIVVLAYKAAKEARVNRLQIRYSYYLDTPALIGLFYPMIIIPHDMLSYDDEVIYHILLHELVHYGEQHLLFQWAFWLVKAIYWFNPIVWIAHEWMKMDAEYACDDEVLHILGQEQYSNYGHNLIELSAHQGKRSYAIHASGLVNNGKELRKRIERIGNGKKKWRILEVVTVLILIVMIPLFFTVEGEAIANRTWSVRKALTGKTIKSDRFSLEPSTYSYDSKTGEFIITMDYDVDQAFYDEVFYNSYVLSFGLTFPQSYNKDVRENSGRDTVVLSEAVKASEPLTLKFKIDDYNIEAYGEPVLIFLGYEIGYNFQQDQQMTVDIRTEALPIEIIVDEQLTLEVVQAEATDDKNYTIGYKYQLNAPIEFEKEKLSYMTLSEEFSLYDQEGNLIPRQESSGGSSDDFSTSHIRVENPQLVDKVTMTIRGYRIRKDNVYLWGRSNYQTSDISYLWTLPIETKDVTYE
jgi:beta-lactamase regulating signal transducer with metallopeptidase domain